MNTHNKSPKTAEENVSVAASPPSILPNKYFNSSVSSEYLCSYGDFDALETILESENQHNKTKTWNKLDKTQRLQKLHSYAEKYVNEHGLPLKEIKALKSYFSKCLDEQKLQKTKEVNYNKDTREVVAVNGLGYNMEMHAFFIRNVDPKHVSTIKSLTPKRNSEKNQSL